MTWAGIPVPAFRGSSRSTPGTVWARLMAGIRPGGGGMGHLAESLRALGSMLPGCRVGTKPRSPEWDGCRKEMGLKVLMCSIVAAGLIAAVCQVALTRFVGESSAQAYSTSATRL